jgi:hypothetical protein
MDLEIVIAESHGRSQAEFSLRGSCPHCGDKVSFSKTQDHQYAESVKDQPEWGRWYPIMRCAGCLGFILAVLRVKETRAQTKYSDGHYEVTAREMIYETHYPAGSPDDLVDNAVPVNIADDFKEAIRCRWVNAYNATAEMCRRAIQSSCLQLGANPQANIRDQIDHVHSRGKITTPLRDLAHKIRLGGNRGGHPPRDPSNDTPLTANEADAVIAFTRHYLDHVYVVPHQLEQYDFSRSGREAPRP